MKLYGLRVAFLVTALGCWGCDLKQKAEGPQANEDLTIVVEADRSKIEAERRELATQREQVEQEKARVEEAMRKSQGDQGQVQSLKEMQRRLAAREKSLAGKLDALANKEVALLKRAPRRQPGNLDALQIAGREKAVAQREGELARREKDLARREAALAQREAEFIKLQSTKLTTQVVTVASSPRTTGRVSRRVAEKAFKSATRKMRSKGILWADLPDEMSSLRQQIMSARKKGDFTLAKDLTDQLEAALSATVIDAGFISRKWSRLNSLSRSSPPKNKQAWDAAFRKVAGLINDNKHLAANKEINRMFGMLDQ